MPCYNCEDFLVTSIESVLNQSFESFEFIIVNDGSSDSSLSLIKNFKDSRIKLIDLKKNRGNYVARNIGMNLSSGKYICVMDADDIAHPEKLNIQYTFLQKHPYITGIGSQAAIIDQYGKKIGKINNPTSYKALKTFLLKDNYTIHSSLMFRKSHIVKYNFFYKETFPYAADYELVVRCAQNCKILNIDEELISYRRHYSQISSQKKAEQSNVADIIRIQQLNRFVIPFTKEQQFIYLQLMKGRYLFQEELSIAVDLLNQLLEKNHRLKLYPNNVLHSFLSDILLSAEYRSKLGGWSIEPELLQFIKTKISSGHSILEFGSGAGTEALLRSFKVTSIEHDPHFARSIFPNHKLVYAPLKNGWYDVEVLKEIEFNQYDLILIDGPPGELRGQIIDNIGLFKGINTPVIFDDINRELDQSVMKAFCQEVNFTHQIFEGKNKQFAFCTKRK